MQIKVHNPNNLPVMDYRDWIPLQGSLKDLTETNYKKLKNVLIKRGYTIPAILWQQGDIYYIIDAHQRQRVMIKENMQPYEVPYILIDADSEAEAKAQLLEIASQYGSIRMEGYDSFIVDLPEIDIQDINFDALQFVGEKTSSQNEKVECPTCGSQVKADKIRE